MTQNQTMTLKVMVFCLSMMLQSQDAEVDFLGLTLGLPQTNCKTLD